MVEVSVVIPVYNGEKFLQKCLDSILAQVDVDFEVIAVDDGSKDGSLSILEEYAVRDSRLRVLSQPNGGAGAARNHGMSVARGRYLFIFDADDYCELFTLRRMLQRAHETDADVVICRSRSFDNENGRIGDLDYSLVGIDESSVDTGSALRAKLFQFCVGWSWDKLFKKSFVDKCDLKFQHLRTTNDAFFVFVGVALADRVAYVEDHLIYHRVNNPLSLERTRDLSWDNSLLAIRAIGEKLREEGIYDQCETSFSNWVASYLFWHLSTLAPDTRERAFPAVRELAVDVLGDFQGLFDNEYNQTIAHAFSFGWDGLFEDYVRMFERYDRETARLKAKCAELESDLQALRQERQCLQDQIDQLSGTLSLTQGELDRTLDSTTFKVGRVVMGAPCAIKRFVDDQRRTSGK